MAYLLHDSDNEILNFLGNSENFTNDNLLKEINTDISNEKELIKLLPYIITTSKIKKKIEFLMKLFNILYRENIATTHENTLSCISNRIVKYFCNSNYNTNFPKNLFSGNFLEYLIQEDKYFNSSIGFNLSILNCLVESKETVDYFNVKILPNHVSNYVVFIDRVYIYINQQIMTYATLSPSLVNRSLNIISLVTKYIDTSDAIDPYLINSAVKLYMLIYTSYCEAISLNRESIEVYKHLSNNSNNKYNSILREIETEIVSQLNIINILRLNRTISCIIIKNIETLNINDNSTEYYDELFRILPFTMNNELYIGIEYEQYEKNCADYVPKILDSDSINIHQKCKFILEVDEAFYTDEYCIQQLIKLFISIEPFNPDSGFNDKTKVRNRIIKILCNLETTNSSFITNNIEFSEFATLLTAHINEVMCRIVQYKRNIQIQRNIYTPSNLSKLLLIKYILYLNSSVKLLNKFATIDSANFDNHFYYKQSELIFSITKYSISENIYCNLLPIDTGYNRNRVIDESTVNILSRTYMDIFSYISTLVDNRNYVLAISDSPDFYNKNELTTTITKYGGVKFENEKSIKDVLTEYMVTIDEAIHSQKKESYSEDIPVKFMDPILFSTITHPIEIPDVKEIMDKYTIMNHLTFSETNPFTNKELTKKQLLEYNLLEEVKSRINEFNNEFDLWKSEHKQEG